MPDRYRQLCRRSGARQQRIDRAQDRLATGAARLVAPQRLEFGGLERAQQRDDLLRLELVVFDPADRGRQAWPGWLGPGGTAPARRHVLHRLGRTVAADYARAAAQELLDLALVAVPVAVALAEQRGEALQLAQLQDGLAGGEAVAVAACLQLAVVDRAPEAQLLEHLGRDPEPGPAQSGGRESSAPRRQQWRPLLAEEVRDLRERQDTVRGGVVDAVQVVAHCMLEDSGDVVAVDELVARVEAQDRRDHRQREVPNVREVQQRPRAVG